MLISGKVKDEAINKLFILADARQERLSGEECKTVLNSFISELNKLEKFNRKLFMLHKCDYASLKMSMHQCPREIGDAEYLAHNAYYMHKAKTLGLECNIILGLLEVCKQSLYVKPHFTHGDPYIGGFDADVYFARITNPTNSQALNNPSRPLLTVQTQRGQKQKKHNKIENVSNEVEELGSIDDEYYRD